MNDLRLVTLDLDDTLWPIAPAIERAEAALHAWFAQHCPATARMFTPPMLRALRVEANRLFPDLSGDMTALRLASIRLALNRSGEDEAHADAAFAAFQAARNAPDLYEDVIPALKRLKSRYTVAALSNGNGCVKLAGLAEYFDFSLSAREAGCAKPARDIFRQACARAGVEPEHALHAGDDLDCDVRGALNAGMHAAWICREQRELRLAAKPALTFSDLRSLALRLCPAVSS